MGGMLMSFDEFSLNEERTYPKVNQSFTSEHKLAMETGTDKVRDDEVKTFRVGTCTGTWDEDETAYKVISIHNATSSGNGHFRDAMQWFAHLARRDNKNLMAMQVSNFRVRKYLQREWGFREKGNDHLFLRHADLRNILRKITD